MASKMRVKQQSVGSHESQTNLISRGRQRGESSSTAESSFCGQTDDNSSISSSSDITAGSDIYEGSVPSYPAPPPPRRPRPHQTMPECQPIQARNEYICPVDQYESALSENLSLSDDSVDMRSHRRHRSSREDTMQSRRSTANQRVFKRRSLIIVNIVALTFSCTTLIVAILSLAWQIVPNMEAHKWSDEYLQACLPCKDLTDNLREKLVKTGGGKNCCARTSGQLSEMVIMLMDEAKEMSTEQPPPSKYQFSPVSAHVHLYPFGGERENRGEGKDPEMFNVKLNQDPNLKGQHVRGVTRTSNRLMIHHAGTYYIYASVYFKSAVKKKPCKEGETWNFHVSRHHPDRPSRQASLIKGVYKCSEVLTNEHHTSFSGGVFELKEGDDIFVTVSDEKVVSFTDSMSFLGLVMLASE